MTVVSSFLSFPKISWWGHLVNADTLILDAAEHFEKMSYRNRYHISGANNSILLSVPLINGRNQRVPMNEVRIHNGDRWQIQHWRTLVSVYKRSPFFDHYEDSLSALFETEFTRLIDFDRASIEWVKQQLKMKFEIQVADTYQKDYPDEITDIRNFKGNNLTLPKYYQVFEERVGFIPDLSILDLLFSEGPGAVDKLKS
jgi:WbqC-like protein family